ncbi:MAG: HAD-IC family P-type ATPase [Patescibacteria group bacterium]
MNNQKYSGLTETEIRKQREISGENILGEQKPSSLFAVFFHQFKSPLVYTLALASIISLVFREYSDFWIILAVIIINALIGAYQEYHAENTFLALKKMLKPKALAIRDGKRKEIFAFELVPGDIVVLSAGDQVPADGKPLEVTNLVVDEKIFTGEDEPVTKELGENSKLLMGTKVLSGVGIMEVVGTGKNTEIGKISHTLSEIKRDATPLQKRLEKFAKNLLIIMVVVATIIFLLGLIRGEEIWTIFRLALILAVASIPEGIPIATTVIMALGMRRILKRNGLVKNLLSVETLGSTSVICTDKTGTLTEGVMEVVRTDFIDEEKAHLSMVLANQQKDGLEISLWEYVKTKSPVKPENLFDKLEKTFEDPFDSVKKYSMAVVQNGDSETGFILGAPEIVLEYCKTSEKESADIRAKIQSWAREGLKVVGAAYKDQGEIKKLTDWKWLGILGIDDPIREEVKETLSLCRKAGIAVKIVTGDYKDTAIEVGRKLGFEFEEKNVADNKELDAMSSDELAKNINDIHIFARVTPDQKLKIVEALQKNGEVVAMTGDGVNDVLALKKANIGVVVANATDVAKEAADLVLLDSNFKTIYAACEEGRTILSNIKKAVGYALSDAFVEMIIIFLAVLLNFPVPITIVMILWINLICDGPNDILLGFESKEDDIMEISPKVIQKESIFDRLILAITVTISSSVGILSLIYFWYIRNSGGDLTLARTIVFTTIALASLVYIFNFKNLRTPIWKIKNFSQNKYLFWGVSSGLVLILAAIYLPVLQNALGTTPLKLAHWIPAIFVGIISALLVEILKFSHKNRAGV